MGSGLTECTHSLFCDSDYEPSKEEINIFRLWKCDRCKKWLSFVDVVKGDKQYEELRREGFKRTYQHINWS